MEALPAITRENLANFIECSLMGSSDRDEWQRLIVNHYRDPEMEAARVQWVRLIVIKASGDPNRLSPDDVAVLRTAMATLR